MISMMAEQAIAAMGRALPDDRRRSARIATRARTRFTAPGCAGVCLGSVGMALHHKLCHVVGGSFNLPHADTHTVILPYAMAYNAKAAPEADQAVARALGGRDSTTALVELAKKLGSPQQPEIARHGGEPTSTAPPISPFRTPTGIRGRSSGHPFAQLIADAWAGNPPRAA